MNRGFSWGKSLVYAETMRLLGMIDRTFFDAIKTRGDEGISISFHYNKCFFILKLN